MTKINYGLTDQGLSIPNFDVVKADIESSIVAELGAVDFEAPSVYGVLTSIVAERELVIWEQVQSIFNSFFVDTATGTSLDYVVAGNLLSRLRPTYTKVTCQLSGSNYTNIPAGSQVLLKHSDTTFTLQQQVVLSNESCYSVNISVNNIDKAEYSITINGSKVSYTKLSYDTEALITECLKQIKLKNDSDTLIAADLKALNINIDTTTSIAEDLKKLNININTEQSVAEDLKKLNIKSATETLLAQYFNTLRLKSDTIESIAQSLSKLIDKNSYKAETNSNLIKITTADLDKSFSCLISEGLEITQVTNNAIFICDQTGNIAAPSHSLTEIQTPIQGWYAVDNISSGTAGRNLETDVELRKRQRDSLNIGGSATDYAIEARLAQVAGVTSVKVISDRDAHTINALVLGGEDNDIAKTLQIVRPAGIKLIGNTEKVVTDSSGTQYAIKFTRPQNVYIFVKVTLTKNDAFKDTAVDVIKSKIINYVNALGVSSIVAYQALYAAIYSVAGVTNAEVLIGGTLDENTAPTLKAENVTISNGQMPITHTNKITINVT